MRCKAKLYLLVDKDWKPLADLINNHKDYKIKSDVTIYQLMTETCDSHHYAILSLSDQADKLVEDYGAYHSPINTLIATLPDYNGEALFGAKSNTIHLINNK